MRPSDWSGCKRGLQRGRTSCYLFTVSISGLLPVQRQPGARPLRSLTDNLVVFIIVVPVDYFDQLSVFC